jgi:hypothetical protein
MRLCRYIIKHILLVIIIFKKYTFLILLQVSNGLDGSTTPLEGAIYYDDEDNDLSTYRNKNVQKETSSATTTPAAMDAVPVRKEDNELFTEATVTSPPHTTVINGFILPQTVRNFFKRPTFNSIETNGIETVRTSEQKQLETKTTTQRISGDTDTSTTPLGTTELFVEETTKLSLGQTTMSPSLLSLEDASIKSIKESVQLENNEPVTTGNMETTQEQDSTEILTSTETPITTVSDLSTGTTAVEGAQDSTNVLEEKLSSNEISTEVLEGQKIETTERPTTVSDNSTKLEDGEPDRADNIKKEDEDDKMQVKKEEKRPASTSPVSDLLNGIYRLISVSICMFLSKNQLSELL